MTYTEVLAKMPEDLPRKPIIIGDVAVARTQLGNVFVCSVEDYDLVKRHKITERNDFGYVEFRENYKSVKLNRLIANRLGAKPNEMLDHIDGNKLNYLRSNVRVATRGENNMNRHVINNKTGYAGVTFMRGRYTAKLQARGKFVHVGCFNTAEEAATARNAAAIVHHGAFAALNIIKVPVLEQA
jgi:hypothetical protein